MTTAHTTSSWIARLALAALALGFGAIGSGCATAAYPGRPTTQITHEAGPSMSQAQRYDGPRARIAVGDFQVKASGADLAIGDGLREMLLTSLFHSNRFIVIERQALQGLLLEQNLGASGRVAAPTAARMGRLEGADLLVYGVVSEFRQGNGASGFNIGIPNLPLTLGGGFSNTHLAVDLRVADVETGRIVYASRVEGKSSDFSGRVGTRIGSRRSGAPVSFGGERNTPVAKAARAAIDTALVHLAQRTPEAYFRF